MSLEQLSINEKNNSSAISNLNESINFDFHSFCHEIDEIIPDIARDLHQLQGKKISKYSRKVFTIENEPNIKKYYIPVYNSCLNSHQNLRLAIFGGYKILEYGDILLDPQEIMNVLLLKDNCPQWKSSNDFEHFLNSSDENELSVANMLIVHMHETYFNLKHRFVHPLYRKKLGIGSAMLYTVEQLMKERGALNKTSYTLLATMGQKNMIGLLKKYGYEPFKERDRELMEKIERSDPSIILGENLYYFPVLIPKEKRTVENFRNGVRIQLYKAINP